MMEVVDEEQSFDFVFAHFLALDLQRSLEEGNESNSKENNEIENDLEQERVHDDNCNVVGKDVVDLVFNGAHCIE